MNLQISKRSFAALSCTLSLGCVSAHSDELKVDVNQSNGRRDVLSTRGENWVVPDGVSASRQFGPLTVTLRNPENVPLRGVLFKGALDFGARMVADGVTVAPTQKPTAQSGVLELVLKGLTPGRHTLVTYHNDTDDGPPSAFDVVVNGEVRARSVSPTRRVTSDFDATSVFLELDAVAGRDVVVRFVPTSPTGRAILNGFELDTPDPKKRAQVPSPAQDEEHVAPDTPLSWRPVVGASGYNLYWGDDEEQVAHATPQSREFRGHLAGTQTQWVPPTLDPQKTYFWRVDTVQNGEETPTRGEVWRFRPRFLAFPTAEGYGRFARGGRGGRVIEVTSLDDYGADEAVIPGSFRAAVEAQGPRTIVFRVSGIIRLKSPCPVRNPYATIAGQTAPGDGICIANYSSGAYSTHDVIIRFVRFRIGDFAHKGVDGAGMGGCDHTIMDHNSISWASDEGSSSRGAHNITFQRNIISESLHHSYHYNAKDRSKFETHAFAASISGDVGSFHHNLLAHCTDRNWSLAGGYNQGGQYGGFLDIRNNVVYNWTARTTDGGVMGLNYVNNYYKPYPQNPYAKWLLKLDKVNVAAGTPRYYMSGNVMEGENYQTDNWKAFQNGPELEALVRSNTELFPSYVKTESAQEALGDVLSNVGATFPRQDVIDRRVIEEVRTGTTHYTGTKGPAFDPPGRNFPGIIDEPSDVKDAADSLTFPWPNYRTYDVPADSDHDGMPDEWETRRGLNPRDAHDGNADRDGDGYTNLEEYLGFLVGEIPDLK